VGLAQKSTFNSPLSHMHHSSASFVPPYGHINNMAPVSHMVPLSDVANKISVTIATLANEIFTVLEKIFVDFQTSKVCN
jgi:hypothetical protein